MLASCFLQRMKVLVTLLSRQRPKQPRLPTPCIDRTELRSYLCLCETIDVNADSGLPCYHHQLPHAKFSTYAGGNVTADCSAGFSGHAQRSTKAIVLAERVRNPERSTLEEPIRHQISGEGAC